MKKSNLFLLLLITLFFSAGSIAISAPPKDVMTTAKAEKNLSTFILFLKTANLTERLNTKGPYTIFAPTNEAFTKIPKQTLMQLLQNKKQLTQLLTYHIIPAYAPIKDMQNGLVATMSGQNIEIKKNGEQLTINNSNIIRSDLVARNGVIHEIDSLLMPPPATEEKKS